MYGIKKSNETEVDLCQLAFHMVSNARDIIIIKQLYILEEL